MNLKVIFIIFISVFLYAEDDEVLKILNKASKLKPSKYPDFEIYDPFQKALPAIKKAKKIKITPTPPAPTLKAIINNTAYIDGAWRKVGDYINGYKVLSIGDESVVLGLGDKNITISITTKGSFFQIINPKR